MLTSILDFQKCQTPEWNRNTRHNRNDITKKKMKKWVEKISKKACNLAKKLI